MDTLAQKQYKKLAEKLVALKIGSVHLFADCNIRYRFADDDTNMYASEFVSDARVMAAAMELVRSVNAEAWCRLMRGLMDEYHTKDMVLAITATCVELLEELR